MSVPDEGFPVSLTMSVPDEGFPVSLTMSVPDEGYSRIASCALNYISTGLFIS